MLDHLKIQSARMALLKLIAGRRSRTRGPFKRLISVFRREEGVSAIEFAILTPFAAVIILSMGMISIIVKNYIDVDQILRAGAAAAINDPNHPAVTQRMIEAAASKGYYRVNTPGTGVTPGVLYLNSARNCFCPEDPNGMLGCNTICANQRPTAVRYTLSALYQDPILLRFHYMLSAIRSNSVIAYTIPNLRTQVIVR